MPPQLLRPRDEVKAALQEQIDRARTELLNEAIYSEEDYRRIGQTMRRWQQYVGDLLTTLFTEPGPINEFNQRLHVMYAALPLQEQIQELHRDVETLINRLQSILERVDLYEESPDAKSQFAILSDVELIRLLEPLLGQIRQELEAASDVEPDVKADIVGDLDSVVAQQRATTPNRGVIRASLDRIKDNWPAVVAGGIGVVANIIAILHGL